MEESSCDQYFRSKNIYPDEDIHMMVLKLLRADPDPNGSNCQWIIDSFVANQFIIDEDEERVKEDILKYKKLFGEKRPLPKKGYSEMKVMIREKMDKETKKLSSKSQTSKTSKTTFTDCKSFFKNVQKTLPEPYNSYSKERSDKLFEMIQNANPSDDFQVCIWIVEEIKRGYIKEEELDEVKKYLIRFLKLDLPLPNFYPNFPTYSNYQLVKDTINKNVDLLSSSDFGILLIPRNTEASCLYGAQSSWCTARRDKNNMFMEYSKKGDIFIWFDKKLKDKFQFHFGERQFMDRDDNPISKQRFGEFVKHPILGVIFKEGLEKIKKSGFENIQNFTQDFYPEWNFIKSPEYFQVIMKDPRDAYLYARDVIKGPWPEAEPYIMKDPRDAYLYARDVIKGPWPEVEPLIINSPFVTEYAYDVKKDRWPKAEDNIFKSDSSIVADYFSKYNPNYVLTKDLSEIMSAPDSKRLLKLIYNSLYLKCRIPKELKNFLENVAKILTETDQSRELKIEFNNLLLKTLEKYDLQINPIFIKYILSLSLNNSDEYYQLYKRKGVIEGFVDFSTKPIPELENIIFSDKLSEEIIYQYFIKFYSKNLNEMLDKIKNIPSLMFNIARDFIQARWPEAEPYIMKDLGYASLYAQKIIGDRWPEAEPYILEDEDVLYYYLETFNLKKEDLMTKQ
jgi:hypothetical protein